MANKENKLPYDDRRDDLRFQLHTKMLKRDYTDQDLSKFYAKVQNSEVKKPSKEKFRTDMLKQQLNHQLKRIMLI